MGWIVGTILMLVLALACWPLIMWLRKKAKENQATRDEGFWKAWLLSLRITRALFILGVILLAFFSSFTTVSTKNVGIETSFGATAGHLSNGAHMVPPWYRVTEMDAAVQTDSYTGKDCLDVRIANQQTACVNVSIRWRICASKAVQVFTENGVQRKSVCDPNAADELFQNYRTFDHVRDSLVTRELTAAVNQQFSSYNPLNSVLGGVLPKGERPNPSLTTIAVSVTDQMRREIGTQIEVLNTIIPIVTFDPATQSRINQLQQQIALTRIAEQEKVTNTAQAEANRALASSVNQSPNVLVAQCYQILSAMVKANQTVPAGFSCWPGNGLAAVIAGPTSSVGGSPKK